MNEPQESARRKRALCASAVVWLLLAMVLPSSELWSVVLTLIAMGVTYVWVKSRAINIDVWNFFLGRTVVQREKIPQKKGTMTNGTGKR